MFNAVKFWFNDAQLRSFLSRISTVGGGNSCFFSFTLGAFAFFALFFLRAFTLFFCFALASTKVRKKHRRPPLFTVQAVWQSGKILIFKIFNFQTIFYGHIWAFLTPSRPLHGHSRPPICHGQEKFSTATFLENGRRHGHLATLITSPSRSQSSWE